MGRTTTSSVEPGVSVPEVRLVAVDLDGTLLNDAKQVSAQTVAALACLPPRGVRVVIASARPPRSVRHVYRQLGLDSWQINYNGALIWDEPGRRAVFHRPMAGERVRGIIAAARSRFEEVLVTCEILDRWYTDRFEQTYTTATGRLFRPDVIAPLETFCNQAVTKLMLLGERRMIDRLESMLLPQCSGDVTLLRTDEELLQIMDRGASKSAALRMVAEHYGVGMEQVMAIGDAPNDVGMVQLAGVGVAMDNAHQAVKKVADWVAPSNNDHGVHAALRRYGLCE
jgi:5-amino-6-(5-phospho-D-ribitylamino)uracil phosphatase